MSLDAAIDALNAQAAQMERLAKMLLTALVLILTGALWAARLEWKAAATADEVAELKPQVQVHGQQLANIEGRLHGIASQVGKVPSRVAAKLQPEEPQQ